jgi:hypothetical protein
MTLASSTMVRSSPLLRPTFPAYPQTYRGMSTINADDLKNTKVVDKGEWHSPSSLAPNVFPVRAVSHKPLPLV